MVSRSPDLLFGKQSRGELRYTKQSLYMDIRAFGSVYGQTSMLPYASGFGWAPAMGRKNFPTCRAIFIEAKSSNAKDYLTVELSDAPGQHATAINLDGNDLIPIACTALISGSVNGVFVLY